MVIPPNSAQLFDLRKSPCENNDLKHFLWQYWPWLSGAPVLNSDNRAVGVVDGGLRGGAVAISWAIPITAGIQRKLAAWTAP